MTIAVLTIGDTFDNTATLYSGDPAVPFSVSAATSIKATITSRDGSFKYCQEVEIDRNAPGSDWVNGVIVYNFAPDITRQIGSHVYSTTIAILETQVEINGSKYTWRAHIKLKMGMIA